MPPLETVIIDSVTVTANVRVHATALVGPERDHAAATRAAYACVLAALADAAGTTLLDTDADVPALPDEPAAATTEPEEPTADAPTPPPSNVVPIGKPKQAKPTADAHACEHCDRSFAGVHGLAVHVARTHGPNAVSKKSHPTGAPAVDPADPATGVFLLRCAEPDCDVAAPPKDQSKFRSHMHTAHGRAPSKDELTPRLEHSEIGGGGRPVSPLRLAGAAS